MRHAEKASLLKEGGIGRFSRKGIEPLTKPMSFISHQQLIDQLNWRYATKQFDPNRKISAADLHKVASRAVHHLGKTAPKF